MFLHNWLHSFRVSATPRRPKPKRRPILLQLERLEDRLTPAPIVLSAANAGQLQADIGTVNTNLTQPYIIQLTGRTYQLTAQQNINNTAGVTIEGLGAASAAVINAAANQRVFQIGTGANVTFENLTIQGGRAADDGSSGTGQALGGGILDLGGNVTLNNVVVQNNHAMGGIGASAAGGGIFVSLSATEVAGVVHISNSTISGNSALGGPGNIGGNGGLGQGGGMATGYGGTLNILNSSITGNFATGGNGASGYGGGLGQGGGLSNVQGTVQMLNTTVAKNTAQGGNGGDGQGGGVYEASFEQDSYLNDTVAFNTALAGAGGAASGGGFFVDSESNPPLLINNMLETNTAATDSPDYSGPVNANSSNNFVSNASNANGATTFNATNILNVAAPQLGAATIAPNGTTYYPVLPTSVTAKRGTLSVGPLNVLQIIANAEGVPVSQTIDQIGNPRFRNDPTIDIGATQDPLPTTTIVTNVSAPFTNADPEVTLVAVVTTSEGIVNRGQVQFTIAGLTPQPLVAPVVNGRASITFGVPPNTPLGNYAITAVFVDGSNNFVASAGVGALTVFPSPTTPILTNVSIVYGMFGVQETLTAVAVNALGVVVNEGFITFSDGGQTVTAPIINSLATVTLNIPFFSENPFAHSIAVGYGDSTGNLLPSISLPQLQQTFMEFILQLIALLSLMQENAGNT